MEKNYDDIFLARWLNNDLSSEELKDFKLSKEFKIYNKIAEKSSEFNTPEFDKERVLKSIKAKINPEKKVVKLVPNWMYAAAASVVVLLATFFFITQPKTVSTNYGEQLAITLPDNSTVLLNAKSIIKYSEKNWKENRTINLEGEAYFKVAKGSTFKVKSKEGEVVVLGTEFTINTQKEFFEVFCYEGKVKAYSKNEEVILAQGNAFRKEQGNSEKWIFTDNEPSWKNGESSFKSSPLKIVIKSLENQYNIKIDASKVDITQRFTGSFTHKNLEVALQTVFVPMKIGATFTKEKTVLLVKQ